MLIDSRTTLDTIVAPQNMARNSETKRDREFDMSQVRVNPEIFQTLDDSQVVLDRLIGEVMKNVKLNEQFLRAFEEKYEAELNASKMENMGSKRSATR